MRLPGANVMPLRNKTRPAESATRREILDVAERLAQTVGFNGFSYADIAQQVGITKASLHYHFPTKAELGLELIERYAAFFNAALKEIDARHVGARSRLEQYVKLYAQVLRGKRMCLCGMLAAEHATLPAPMQAGLRRFFDLNERWLAKVLAAGRQDGSLEFHGSASEEGRLLLGALEGAMLVAHSYGDVKRFEAAARRLIRTL
jgi:TetR/AcrR family transcriptional repressor of nem operon